MQIRGRAMLKRGNNEGKVVRREEKGRWGTMRKQRVLESQRTND